MKMVEYDISGSRTKSRIILIPKSKVGLFRGLFVATSLNDVWMSLKLARLLEGYPKASGTLYGIKFARMHYDQEVVNRLKKDKSSDIDRKLLVIYRRYLNAPARARVFHADGSKKRVTNLIPAPKQESVRHPIVARAEERTLRMFHVVITYSDHLRDNAANKFCPHCDYMYPSLRKRKGLKKVWHHARFCNRCGAGVCWDDDGLVSWYVWVPRKVVLA